MLQLLAESRSGLTLRELAQQLAIPRTSAHCLLLTFERLGYLHRNPKTSRYMVGLKLFSLANLALTRDLVLTTEELSLLNKDFPQPRERQPLWQEIWRTPATGSRS